MKLKLDQLLKQTQKLAEIKKVPISSINKTTQQISYDKNTNYNNSSKYTGHATKNNEQHIPSNSQNYHKGNSSLQGSYAHGFQYKK